MRSVSSIYRESLDFRFSGLGCVVLGCVVLCWVRFGSVRLWLLAAKKPQRSLTGSLRVMSGARPQQEPERVRKCRKSPHPPTREKKFPETAHLWTYEVEPCLRCMNERAIYSRVAMALSAEAACLPACRQGVLEFSLSRRRYTPRSLARDHPSPREHV